MQSSRLLSILLRLQTQGRISAQALAAAFEVSVRTIYRDIDALSAAGVPVYAEKGRNGGFQLLDGYRTRLTGLDRPEAESLFLAGVPFAASQLGLGNALATTRLKLLAALPEAARRDAERVASRFHLDPVAWFQGPDLQRLLPELAGAVWQRRWLQMRYESWKGIVDRRVLPLGLVLKAGVWYLVGSVDNHPRTYRVAGILTLLVEQGQGEFDGSFDLAAHWNRFCQDYEDRMQSGRARVRVRGNGLRALSRLSRPVAEAVAEAVAEVQSQPMDAEGWLHLTIPIESVEIAIADLLRLGPDVQALAPNELVQGIRQHIQDLTALYDQTPIMPEKADIPCQGN
jgi:predicted DNA-binding transcriptional regulator YafY